MSTVIKENDKRTRGRILPTRTKSSQRLPKYEQQLFKIIVAKRDYKKDYFVSFDCNVPILYDEALREIIDLSGHSCSYIGFKNVDTSDVMEFAKIKTNHYIVFPGRAHQVANSIHNSSIKKFKLGVEVETYEIFKALQKLFKGEPWQTRFDWSKPTRIKPESLVKKQVVYRRGF